MLSESVVPMIHVPDVRAAAGMREFIIRDLNRFWITFGQAKQQGP